jgi:hypothetical protein
MTPDLVDVRPVKTAAQSEPFTSGARALIMAMPDSMPRTEFAIASAQVLRLLKFEKQALDTRQVPRATGQASA